MKAEEIVAEEIKRGKIKTPQELQNRKIEIARELGLSGIIRNSDILRLTGKKKEYLKILQKKPTRTASGVAVIAVMSSPAPCPHGRCTYCPGGNDVPNAYTGREPSAMRAAQHDFDSYEIVRARIEQLHAIGHPTDKCEVIIMGGTFTSRPQDYKINFVKGVFDGLNGFFSETLEEAQRKNEDASNRCVGLTFETRPDWCKKEHIDSMLSYGATRVELGVQTLSDEIYKNVGRGHTVVDVIEATRLLKDAGLKVAYHMMPGMPGSNFERDMADFKTLFENPDFCPDMIKFYPCLVFKNTPLYEEYKKGTYTPYSTEEALRLLLEVKKIMPPWVRTMRIQRDIPVQLIEAGVKNSNLGQMLHEEMIKKGIKCQCIRCREVGLSRLRGENVSCEVEMVRREYDASEGREIFLSFEGRNKNLLVGFLRLRIPSEKIWRPEMEENTVLVRELHVYGFMAGLHERGEEKFQHKGFGERLLGEAERISKEEVDAKRMLVTSGVGARNYYRRLGYADCGVYVGKGL